MNEKTLFEIPIYAMSEKEFNKRWDKKKHKLMISGHSEEDAKELIRNIYFPRTLWKYNQIIGFIIIAATQQDIVFEIFCSMDRKYYLNSQSKHFIQYYSSLGNHFPVIDETEEGIKQKVCEMLKRIEKYDINPINRNYYIDYSTFNNVIDFVNIKQIMKSL